MSGMKAKTIKSILRKKYDDFLKSIDDDNVRSLLEKNGIITGGCIASMLLGEQIRDFDLYLKNRETALAVAKYYVSRFKSKNKHGIDVPIFVDENTEDRVRIVVKSAGVSSENGSEKPYEYFEGRADGDPAASEYLSDVMDNPFDIENTLDDIKDLLKDQTDKPEENLRRYRPVFLSTNAITLSDKIQIVLRFYGDPEEIHKNYDFVHATNYWCSWNNELVLQPKALESLLSKELRYVGSKYPICSLIRVRKFIERGWRINAGQILKMSMQVSELDLKDPAVLQEQTTGVDAAFFVELMRKVKEHNPDKVDSCYLCEIIDRMF